MGVPLACEAAVFRAVGGYDDAFRGWGMEDREICERLDRSGIREVLGPASLVETLTHSNAARSSFYERPIDVSLVIGHYYARIKQRHFETTGRALTDEQRHSTFGQVERAVVAALADAASDATFDIRIAGAVPPWSARLRAPEVREYHRAEGGRDLPNDLVSAVNAFARPPSPRTAAGSRAATAGTTSGRRTRRRGCTRS